MSQSQRLDETMTWQELANKTLNKISHIIPQKEHDKFLKWFAEREKIGYNFDPLLWARCYNIAKELHSNLDHFIVISGREGTGKSTLANQIASCIIPDHKVENNCVKAEQYVEAMRRKASANKGAPKSFDSIILDEGSELLSRESYNITNRVLVKTFFVQRALKFLVIVNIPNFHMLDSVIRNHRVRTLIEVISKGDYKCITGKGIKIIAKEGSATKEVAGVRLPNGHFWHGHFNKDFPKTLDWSEYEKLKHQGIRDLMEDLKDDVVQLKMVSIRKVAKEIQCQPDTLIKMVKLGKLEGKQIGNKYYITRKAYDKLLTVPQNEAKQPPTG